MILIIFWSFCDWVCPLKFSLFAAVFNSKSLSFFESQFAHQIWVFFGNWNSPSKLSLFTTEFYIKFSCFTAEFSHQIWALFQQIIEFELLPAEFAHQIWAFLQLSLLINFRFLAAQFFQFSWNLNLWKQLFLLKFEFCFDSSVSSSNISFSVT